MTLAKRTKGAQTLGDNDADWAVRRHVARGARAGGGGDFLRTESAKPYHRFGPLLGEPPNFGIDLYCCSGKGLV